MPAIPGIDALVRVNEWFPPRREFASVGELDVRLFSVRLKRCELVKADPWTFAKSGEVLLRIVAEVDSRDDDKPINIAHQVAIPVKGSDYDVDQFIRGPLFHRWLRGELQSLLTHEIDESIYRDGRLVDDPHKPRYIEPSGPGAQVKRK